MLRVAHIHFVVIVVQQAFPVVSDDATRSMCDGNLTIQQSSLKEPATPYEIVSRLDTTKKER
jgi:hypothetical protein